MCMKISWRRLDHKDSKICKSIVFLKNIGKNIHLISIRYPMSRKFLVVVQIDELCNLRCNQQNTEENQEKFKSNFVSLPYIITTTPPNI